MTAPRLRSCRLVIGAAGYGKTTALREWFPEPTTVWLRGVGARPASAIIDAALAGPAAIVVDDLPPLTIEETETLFDAVQALPAGVRVALASRWPPGVSTSRWRGRGLLAEVGPTGLALTEDRVADVLASDYALTDLELAERVHDATAGWPALVHLTAEALIAGGPATDLTSLVDGDTAVSGYIGDEVLAGIPAGLMELLRDICELSPVTAGLVEALGHDRAAEAVRLLGATGLLTAGATGARGAAGGRLVPLVAWVVRRTVARTGVAGVRTAAAAAGWYDAHGPAIAAAAAYHRAGVEAECLRVVGEHGAAMLGAGDAATVIEFLSPVPERTRAQQLLLGDALRITGNVAAAADAYGALASGPEWGGDLAWRLGLIDYTRGNARAALLAYDRAVDPAPADRAQLLAWQATAHLQLGDTGAATACARLACQLAGVAGDDIALATAHIALALCLGIAGDPHESEEHDAIALRIAERTGNVVLRARVLTNQAYRYLCEARYAAALELAEQTAHWARMANHTNLRSIALCNQADAACMLGRYDEAIRGYERAVALCRRIGSRRSAAALLGLGEVHRRRGWLEQARSAYEAAARVAEESGNNQVLVCALAGLARVLVADDASQAAIQAKRALDLASPKVVVTALLARGWVALRTGERLTAQECAHEAARVARADRDQAGLAESLELRAGLESTVVRARAALREAHTIWVEAGARADAARCLLLLGSLPEASTDDRLGALLAAETLVAAGVHPAMLNTGEAVRGPISVRALGRFEVLVDGCVVPAQQWQSKKARDLLRILVSRRGRPVPRGELCELLWPDDDQAKTGHRLSVLLSIVRSALDPQKSLGADHFVVADQASIALDVTRVDIDLERFLVDVAHGRRLRERGELAQLRLLLAAAVAEYRGDAFEGEPYDEWSGPVRGEARTAYVAALRMLSHACHVLGSDEESVMYLHRLLATDPYDEEAHRRLTQTLAAAGQHGEAARAFATFAEAMAEIGAEPPVR